MDSQNIINVNQADFESKVIDASDNRLIVVDFWAPWCGPCKQLTPIMEKVAFENKDEFDLVKINIDENQELAAQLRIQSIPSVFAFKEKKIVNAFQGVVSEKDFINFIEKANGKKLDVDFSAFYNEIKAHIDDKNFNEAKDKLLTFFADHANDAKGVSLYLECLLAQKEFIEIEEFISSLDEEMKNKEEISKVIKRVEIVKESKNSKPIEMLLENYKKNTKNIKILIEISEYYFSSEDYENAFSFLLENYSKDKEKVKKKLLEFFEALGNDHDATKTYRKKLSSLLFT